jgi:hypothetical protein
VLFIYCLLFFFYTSENVLLIIGIMFNVFFGLGEHLQVFECPVAIWSAVSKNYLSSQHQGSDLLLTAHELPN